MFSEYPDMMSIEEVRAALRIGRSTVYNLIHSGEIRYFKIGASIRVPKNCLLDYVEQNSYNGLEADERP
ncbi:MAG: helix-turn-helix domain-containing protein [Anaerolineaceae bacterium]|nr:helix-turn-helix domain-containing protein [Anaerolineaceae bacterium]